MLKTALAEPAARAYAYTPKELHEMGVAPGATLNMVYAWIQREVPHYRIGRKIFVRADVLFWKTAGLDVKALFGALEKRGLADPLATLAELDRLADERKTDELKRVAAHLEAIEGGKAAD